MYVCCFFFILRKCEAAENEQRHRKPKHTFKERPEWHEAKRHSRTQQVIDCNANAEEATKLDTLTSLAQITICHDNMNYNKHQHLCKDLQSKAAHKQAYYVWDIAPQ